MTVTPPDVRAVPAPLVIGITGHRDLRPEDREKLENKVREVLSGLRAKYPATPIVLLSPLAEGADRLAARVALEIGARLVVPLPMSRHLYEQDFTAPGSLAEFRQLLERAEHCFEVEMLAEEKEVAAAGGARDRQYEAMGQYIARESQMLLALWDGTASDKVGGTAEIVKFQLHGMPNRRDCDLQPPELFPVYHIVTPRTSNPVPQGEPFQLIRQYPRGFESEEDAANYYDQIFRNLDDFNRAVLNGGDSLVAEATQSKRDLLGEFDETKLSPSETLDLDRYAMADALAQRFQREMLRVDRALHWLVLAALLCFVLFAHLPPHPVEFLAGSFVVLGITYVVYKRSKTVRLDDKDQDYRAIAEGCRVRFFWHWAGVRASVADNYLGKQRTELDWIRNGLRGWQLETHIASQTGPLTPRAGLEAVRQLWVDGQIQYFRHATESNEKKLEKKEKLVRSCTRLFLALALVALGAALVLRLYSADSGREERLWMAGLIIAVDFFLAAGALLHHATQQRAHAQHIKQFRRMEAVFEEARKLINQKLEANDLGGVRQCLRRLGQEALSENGDWVLLHRERPLEMPPP